MSVSSIAKPRRERLHSFDSHEDFDAFRFDGDRLVPHMFVQVGDEFGYSPDGVGVYWHEALEDLEEYVRRGYVL